MAAGTIRKQPFEVKDYAMDFAGELVGNETLTLVSCEAVNLKTQADSTAEIISDDPAPAVIGQTVVFWLKDGIDGDSHKITLRVSTSTGQRLESDLDVFVVEE